MKSGYYIGIDLGGTNLKIGLLDRNLKIAHKRVLDTERFVKKELLIAAIIRSVADIMETYRLKRPQVFGIGLGLPGPIDTSKGVVHFFPNIPDWNEVPLTRILKAELSFPVFIDNDANLMALAEHRLGAAKGSTNAVCLTLGTGVGGGIIINKELYRGSTYAAGEIGHMPLNEHGPRCNCGGSGCLEMYIGNRRIMERVTAVFGREIPLEEISSLAHKGNKRAQDIWMEVGTHLGTSLAGVVNLLNPDCVVIGGGVANAGKILFDVVKKTVKARSMKVQADHVVIRKAKLGSDAGLIGAALLVKENNGA
ncbi:MAG: ROK family protein [Candidatus Omnitrophota bacterium]|jgi:glucokinase